MLKHPEHVGRRQWYSVACIRIASVIASLKAPSIRYLPKMYTFPRTAILRVSGDLLEVVQIGIVLVYSHCRYTLKMASLHLSRWMLSSVHSSRIDSKSSHVGEMTDLWTKKEGRGVPVVDSDSYWASRETIRCQLVNV